MSLRNMRSWRARTLLAVAGGAVVLTSAACTTNTSRANDLYRLRMCESGGNYRMVSGGYGGAYAFSIYYWQAAGHPGLPQNSSPAYQDAVALQLLKTNPHQAFPGCSAKLGF